MQDDSLITCKGCHAFVHNTAFGIRSHIIRKPECEIPFRDMGFNSNGTKLIKGVTADPMYYRNRFIATMHTIPQVQHADGRHNYN